MNNYNAIRFVSEKEKQILDKHSVVNFIDQQKPWNDHGTLYFFVIDKYKKEDYEPIIKSLAKYNNIQYDYIVYLNFTGYNYKYLAAYDKEQVDAQLKENQTIPFEIDNTTYDTGPIYVVPEYRRTSYSKRQVVGIEKVGKLFENKNKEALNNMPDKNQEKINLGVDIDNSNEMTFMKLYMELVEVGAINKEVFRGVLGEIEFKEEVGHEYQGVELKVGVAYIPILTDGDIDVKIVKIEQGDSIGLIVPTEVAETYQKLTDKPEEIDKQNKIEEIAFETFGFNSEDEVLLNLVADLYVNSAERGEAYKLTGEAEQEAETEKEENKQEDNLGLGTDPSFGGGNRRMFDDIDDSDLGDSGLEGLDDIDANLESFNKFENNYKELNNLENKLFNKIPKVIRENIKTKYIAKDKILVIEVDNKTIYETFSNLPKHTKSLLTTIGETIRTNENTQLVDSLSHKGKRLFLIAESKNNNFWMLKDEEAKLLETTKTKDTIIAPNKKEIIYLNRTNIRLESRAQVPYKYGEQIVFLNKYRKIK